MAIALKRSKMTRTFGGVVNFLLQSYSRSEIIGEAYSDIVILFQSFEMTEERQSRMLWDSGLHCGAVLSNSRLKSLFNDGLLPGTRAELGQFRSLNRPLSYNSVVRQAQALGNRVRVVKRPAKTAPAIDNSKKARFLRGSKLL